MTNHKQLSKQMHTLTAPTNLYWVLFVICAIPPIALILTLTTNIFHNPNHQIAQLLTHQPEPNWTPIIIGTILSVPFTVFLPLKKAAHFTSTIIHELGHAFGAIISGQGIPISIKLNGTQSTQTTGWHGLTTTLWRGGQGWQKFSTFLGYPSPILYGITLLTLTLYKQSNITVALLTITAIALLILIRNPMGLLITVTFITYILAIYYLLPTPLNIISETNTILLSTILLIWGISTLTLTLHHTIKGNDGGDIKAYAPTNTKPLTSTIIYIVSYYIFTLTLILVIETFIK